MDAATVAGGDPAMLPEPEAAQLVEAERQSEKLRLKESNLKKAHLDDINTFLLVRLPLPPSLLVPFVYWCC